MFARKYVVLFAGCVLQLWLGGLYAWGNETIYFTSWLRQYDPDITYPQTLFTFGTATVALAVGGLPAGLLLSRLGPRVIGVFGALVYAASVFLAVLVRSVTGLVLLYGVVRGAAIGIAHVPPLAVCALYFPGNVGFIQGVVATFFGLGAFVLNFVTTGLVNPDNLPVVDDPNSPDDGYFPPDGEVVGRVVMTWLVLASMISTSIIAAWFIVNPDDFRYEIISDEEDDVRKIGHVQGTGSGGSGKPRTHSFASTLSDVVPDKERLIDEVLNRPSFDESDVAARAGGLRDPVAERVEDEAAASSEDSSDTDKDLHRAESRIKLISSSSDSDSSDPELSTLDKEPSSREDWKVVDAVWHPQFCLVTLIFIFGTIPGHVAIGMYKVHGPGDDAFKTLIGSIAALANGAGRLFFGACVDRAPKRAVLFVMYAIQIGFCMWYPYAMDDKPSFIVVVLALHFLYGGNFAVIPALLWQQFGRTYFGAIYAVVLTAWGLGGLAGDALVNVVEVPFGLQWLCVTLAVISACAALWCAAIAAFPSRERTWRYVFRCCFRDRGSDSADINSGVYDEKLLAQGLPA